MMDEESRTQLIAQATLQNARLEGQRARQQLPFGLFVVGLGASVATAAVLAEIEMLMAVFMAIVAFLVLIPLGFGIVARSLATIVRSRRTIRALAPPAARLLTRS
jgi:hypothetical protein